MKEVYNMKRILSVLFLVLILVASQPFIAPARGQETVSVLVDGLTLDLDVLPVIQNDRTLVPFRAIAEAMNINVSWDNQTRTVNATDGNTNVRLQIDNLTAYRNNTPMMLDVAPQIVSGRTLIPLRFFSEAFNCQVDWNSTLYQVSIISPPQAMTVIGFYALGDSQTSSWTNLFGQAYPTQLQATQIYYLNWPWVGTVLINRVTCFIKAVPDGSVLRDGRRY